MRYGTATTTKLLGIAGLVCCAAGILRYAFGGFSPYLWLFWLVGCGLLLACAAALSNFNPSTARRPQRRDWLLLGLLLLIFAPLYLFRVHSFPNQMNTDEISIMMTAKHLATIPNVDIFAPSYYSDLPGMIFWFLGKLGLLLGGVTLGHMRLLHAMSGVLIILASFILLRLLRLPKYAAFAGAAVIGLNHSLFLISRMAMRDNTALLLMLTALIFLLYGWQRRNYAWTLLGGFVSGLAFYSYYPGRITFALWLAFVFASTLLAGRAGRQNWQAALRLSAVGLLGLVIMATPLFIATSKHVPTDLYASQQFLWQKAAQKQEQQFRGTATVGQAIRINITHGLGAFNQPYDDQGQIYPHPGYGFTDKITGVLLWMGVLVILLQSIGRRRLSEADRFALVGFFTIYLSLAFFLTRAPDYTRMLIVLPFVGYMIARLVQASAEYLPNLFGRPKQVAAGSALSRTSRLGWVIAAGLIVVLGISNGLIVRDFQKIGDTHSDGVGDTLRFQEKHDKEAAQWLFVPGQTVGYYYWGIDDYWQVWFQFGVGDSQTWQEVTPGQLQIGAFKPLAAGNHGYLMTTQDIWQQLQPAFSARQRIVQVTPLDNLGKRVAVEYTNL